MILVFTTAAHQYTFKVYLHEWSKGLKCKMIIASYEDLLRLSGIRPCTIIFSDIERLSIGQRIIADAFCDRIQADSGDKFQILNHPTHSCRRFELLSRLSREGINSFRIYRLDAVNSRIRFPVFLRHADDHSGPVSKLLNNYQQLNAALTDTIMRFPDFENLVIIEYCNIQGEDGIYRKYSAFRIGERILPAHMLFDREWMQKDGRSTSDELDQEETRYMTENPHREQLRKIFDLANIQFGRIDYGLLDGRVQVWEINTNPTILKNRKDYSDGYIGKKDKLAARISQAFDDINKQRLPGSKPVPQFDSQAPALLARLVSAQKNMISSD